MGHRTGNEAQRRNSVAVQRIFQKSIVPCGSVASPVKGSQHGRGIARYSGDRYAVDEASSGPLLRVAQTSAAALVGVTGGEKGLGRPAWCDPDGRGLLSRRALDVPSHYSRQLEVAAELKAYSVPGQVPPVTTTLDGPSEPSRSCFLMELQKSKHARAIDAPPSHSGLTPHELRKDQLKAFHHQQAVLRHEQTIPRRRVIDPYVQLTAAQADASLAVPNTYTADRLVERNEGRWMLDNPHRQQIYRGEPVMTRIMRGEFYGQGAAEPVMGLRRRNVIEKNRRDVRVTSVINRAERQRRQPRPPGACLCTK